MRFDSISVSAVTEAADGDKGDGTYCEQVPEDEVGALLAAGSHVFWSVYGYFPDPDHVGMLECVAIGDYKTREHAEKIADAIRAGVPKRDWSGPIAM